MTTRDSVPTLSIEQAVATLRDGGVIAIPTDTVYGIAAALDHAAAVERLFTIKGRETTKAIPLLVSDADMLSTVAESVDPRARRLVERLWPGALTVVVRARGWVPDVVRRGLPTVGVRMPNHAVTRDIIARTGGVLPVTSANLSGRPEARSAKEVREQLDGLIDGIVDDGPSPASAPSTVIDITEQAIRVLRQGVLDADLIRSILDEAGAE